LAHSVKIGDVVRVSANDQTVVGHVMQIYHQLDETTRTRSVRVEIPNPDDLFHPGQFVNCQIESAHTAPVLALPVEALMRTTDGDWAVYVEKQSGHFQQVEVRMLNVIDNKAVIEGVSSGARVVTKGAFFIHAELNKSAFDTE
jgi:cobalt-zinc-cadmium efflux system membrane fusion protein